ncbi:MAG: nucleotidyltransferase family protein, partial [Rickettsiales bacterium]|nr:nucleotidyltransferase family protein [Rickettsiales bacterium]
QNRMSLHLEKAMVLAAGLGTRMRPITLTTPKPLVKVAGISLLDRVLDWLAASGINDVVVNTHYLAEQVEQAVSTRNQPRVSISPEHDQLLETGGGIARALPLLGGAPFLSANSDTLCMDGATPAITRLCAAWDDAQMDALLLLHPVEKAVGYEGKGDFFLEAGMLTRRGERASAPYVFTGVQILHPRLFSGAPTGAFSMNALYDKNLARVRGLVHDGAWLHVGDPAGLKQAEDWLLSH